MPVHDHIGEPDSEQVPWKTMVENAAESILTAYSQGPYAATVEVAVWVRGNSASFMRDVADEILKRTGGK